MSANERMCDACGARPGRVHFVEIRGTEISQSLLCDVCSQEKTGVPPASAPPAFPPPGFAPPPPSPFPSFDWNLVLAGAVTPTGPVPCRSCGHTWENFRKVGRFGCPSCYEHFRPLLADLLRRIAREVRHHGLRPPDAHACRDAFDAHDSTDLPRLRTSLAEAIAREDFEEAARIRDQILSRKT